MFKLGKVNRQFFLAGTAIISSLVGANAATAQEATAGANRAATNPQQGVTGVEDIIVTAERRSARIQDTPLAISAIGGDRLQKQQVNALESLAGRLPNVGFSRNGAESKVFIRGIGLDGIAPGGDPRVALYTDGVYNARGPAVLGSFYDIERVEVLRGPQGTLYGRNATAGAINVLTRDPTDRLGGYASLTVGNFSLIRTEGAFNAPLSDQVAARISFQTSDRDGYGKHIQTGEDVDNEHVRAVRGKLLIQPNNDLRLLLSADYRKQDDNTGGFHFLGNTPSHILFTQTLGFVVPTNPRDYAGLGPHTLLETYGGAATLTWSLGDATLTSISGYRHLDSLITTNPDGSTANSFLTNYTEESDQFTQELRLNYDFGPVNLIVGGYYFNEKNKATTMAALAGYYFGFDAAWRQGSLFGGTQKTEALAAFSQATVNLSDAFAVDLGLRYSHEKRKTDEFNQFDLTRLYNPANPLLLPGLAQFAKQDASWSSVDPKITIRYKFNNSAMVYGTYSQGFKSGGFNLGALQPRFNPEEITDYEIGLKADWFDRRLRTNLSAFYYDYTNLQVNVTRSLQLITQNAGKAKIYGAEAEITALPTNDLSLSLNFAWLHANYTKYDTVDAGRPERGELDLSGNRLAYAPDFKIDGEIAYTVHTDSGDFTPRVQLAWIDRVYFTQFNLDYVSQPSRTEVNAFLDYTGPNGWSANLFAKNLTNKLYLVSGTVASDFIGYQILGQTGEPRTYGISVTKRF
jgi:iron complex outermembrane receptor protein